MEQQQQEEPIDKQAVLVECFTKLDRDGSGWVMGAA